MFIGNAQDSGPYEFKNIFLKIIASTPLGKSVNFGDALGMC